jgi:hypothetical protein
MFVARYSTSRWFGEPRWLMGGWSVDSADFETLFASPLA